VTWTVTPGHWPQCYLWVSGTIKLRSGGILHYACFKLATFAFVHGVTSLRMLEIMKVDKDVFVLGPVSPSSKHANPKIF
jgi:hypothetical protein